MANGLAPAPIYNAVVEKDGIATLPWILFFNGLFNGDSGTSWTPTFTSLTVVGAAPTITGKYYKHGAQYYFEIRIVPGTNTSSTAGTTYVNNFPLDITADGSCSAVSGLLGGGNGMCENTTNRIYPPAWSAVTVPLTIVGWVTAQ